MSSLNKKTIVDIDLTGQRVLMRVDFNVPQDDTGAITNTQRIVAALPTINLAFEKGAKSVVLMSHLGRPDGQKNPKFSLKPIADKLAELITKPVLFLSDCVGDEVEAACADPAPGSIFVLENMRFYAEEEGKGCMHEEGCPGSKCAKKAPSKGEKCTKIKPTSDEVESFRSSLAKLGDVYVCDAFGTAHRAHSSMVGMSGKMPCVSGLLVAKELQAFSKVLDPELKKTPLTAIVGGAKISDKVLVIGNLIEKSDTIIICGGMAYTFLKTCFGMDIGKSLYDENGAKLAPGLLEKAKEKGCEIVLPCDWACGQDFVVSACVPYCIVLYCTILYSTTDRPHIESKITF
jgi:phosphoglycerate kinase